ncbi:MAG TPA: nucleotide exchange factor GrpE [Terriglobales bacterium]|nr:nucleotide exchange factor GrpE [Terriglobales bacterium]
MGKGNGKSEVNLDLEHELPAADAGEENVPVAGPKAAPSAPSETDKLRAERDALLDRLARLQAEFDNARKRAAREQQEFREFAAADVIKGILPVLDSFERALKAPGVEGSDLRGGLELIYRQFQDALQKLGVQPIPAVGKEFDPRVHEAIEMVDTNEVKDHHVLDELQRGYKYKDRLLRPAMVRVARKSG